MFVVGKLYRPTTHFTIYKLINGEHPQGRGRDGGIWREITDLDSDDIIMFLKPSKIKERFIFFSCKLGFLESDHGNNSYLEEIKT
jgi:hypothetical protein